MNTTQKTRGVTFHDYDTWLTYFEALGGDADEFDRELEQAFEEGMSPIQAYSKFELDENESDEAYTRERDARIIILGMSLTAGVFIAILVTLGFFAYIFQTQ